MAKRFRDLSSGVRLRISGDDRIRFLNGQTTRDVRKANAKSVQESCVLNAKGHLDAHLFLFATTDAIWLSAEVELRKNLPERLERYVIADDVSIEDVTDQFALLHFVAETPPANFEYEVCLRADRLGTIGWDIWIPTERKQELLSSLVGQFDGMSDAEWETLRIEQGIPQWGRELTPDIIPPEANLASRAIDYEKGCYIGQEVISRMKMSGQVRQQLCGILLENDGELVSGMGLSNNGKAAGRITSAIFSSRLNMPIALALIKRGLTEPGTKLVASIEGATVNVHVANLPFAAASHI